MLLHFSQSRHKPESSEAKGAQISENYGPPWLWYGMVPYGPVWSRVVHYGSFCSHIDPYAPLWSRLVTFGPVLLRLLLYGPLWFCMPSMA